MYLVFTRMPGESYRRPLRSLSLYLSYVFRALINSLVLCVLVCRCSSWLHFCLKKTQTKSKHKQKERLCQSDNAAPPFSSHEQTDRYENELFCLLSLLIPRSLAVTTRTASTPSLSQPVKFPGLTVHFWSYNICFLSITVVFMKILSQASAKTKIKRLKAFIFCTFTGRFYVTSQQ